MVSTTRSSKANSASVNPTATKNKPAEEEPQVSFDPVKITQDDEFVIETVTEVDEDSRKINEHYQKSVNQQRFLANPHLANPCMTNAEHVAKLQGVRVLDEEALETITKVTLPLKGQLRFKNHQSHRHQFVRSQKHQSKPTRQHLTLMRMTQ
jgi:hypothetical protein